MKQTNFFDAVRQNTGSHFLDSGGAYGRHHEQPAVKRDDPAVHMSDDGYAVISTAHFLDANFDILNPITEDWEDWDSKNGSDLSWFDSGRDFMESEGYICTARNNTYNSENDLSQDFVWEVWHKEDCGCGDWIYCDDAVTVFYIHCGCDVRGGYGCPIFCKTNNEYTAPIDLVAGFYVIEARRTENEPEDISEHWEIGYSSAPYYEMQKDVKRFFGFTKCTDTICALLNDGSIVKIGCDARLGY